MKHILIYAFVIFSLAGCQENIIKKKVKINDYVIVKTNDSGKTLYGAFKVVELAQLRKFEWIFLADGSTTVDIRNNSLVLGKSGSVNSSSDIQFEEFRVGWQQKNGLYFISQLSQNSFLIKFSTEFCVTTEKKLWGQDLTKLDCKWVET